MKETAGDGDRVTTKRYSRVFLPHTGWTSGPLRVQPPLPTAVGVPALPPLSNAML